MESKEKTIDNSLEGTMNMTQDEIEWLLNQQFGESKESEQNILDDDLKNLLENLEGTNDEDIQDISALLNKADNNEAVDDDIAALLKVQEEPGETAYDAMDLFSAEPKKPEKESFWKKLFHKEKSDKKEKPVKKEKSKEKVKKEKKHKKAKSNNEGNAEQPEWEKIDEQEEFQAGNSSNTMDDALSLLQGITPVEAEAVVPEKKNKEKQIKKKNKKKKETVKEKEKKKSKKADKNEKEEKRVKNKGKASIEDAIRELEEESEELPHKKKIIMVFLASILILIGFLVVNYYFTSHANKKLAQEAYEEKDYLECYQLLYGQKLNDGQAAMYHRSELILKAEIFWRDYEGYAKQGKWLEGLDELVQYVYEYPKLLEYAQKWNCSDVVEDTHLKVQEILAKEYETDVQAAMIIAELESDADYTRALLKIVEEKQKKDAIYQKYPDILPEEEDRLFQ